MISVDTKKKELIGDFKNPGREWQPKGEPVSVRVHDFIDDALGKVVPYGVYDLARNTGWVNVGIDHDTSEFAVESIARWWRTMGKRTYPEATELLITADSGGSNAVRSRLWKLELQRFADRSGLAISVSHFPPGTRQYPAGIKVTDAEPASDGSALLDASKLLGREAERSASFVTFSAPHLPVPEPCEKG